MKSVDNIEFDVDETRIRDALDRKRMQIAREIEDFKIQKEREFAALEQSLRGKGRVTSSEYSTSFEAKFGNEKREEPRGSNHSFDGKGPAMNIGSDSVRTNGINHLSRSTESLCNGRENQQSSLHSLLSNSLRERELEFHGLFTPHYLPLLDGSAHTSKPRSTTKYSEDLQPQRGISSSLSSSATFPSSTIGNNTSLPFLRNFSASVPRERSLGLRRSSSRSDMSVGSRRSSLRDPKQARSAKHVLFSINDVVVSPSTSPVLSRSTAAPPDIDSLSSNKLGKMSISKTEDMETWDKGLSALLKPSNNNNNNPFTASSRYSHKFYDLPTSSSSTILNDEDDDFAPNYDTDGDDLFAFDEEANLSDDDDDNGSGGNAATGSSSASGYGSDEEGDGKDPDMTVGSPGAGSLPIEIRWPGRRDR